MSHTHDSVSEHIQHDPDRIARTFLYLNGVRVSRCPAVRRPKGMLPRAGIISDVAPSPTKPCRRSQRLSAAFAI